MQSVAPRSQGLRDLVDRLFHRAARAPEQAVTRLADSPRTYDQRVADVDPTMRVFAAAASEIRGVRRVSARTAGARVSFIVTVEGRPWDEVVDELEPKLRPLYVGGLSSFDYDVVDSGMPEPVGYQALTENEGKLVAAR